MRIRVRCNVCAGLVRIDRTTARLVRGEDGTTGCTGASLVFRCPSCRCRVSASVHPETARALADGGLRVEDDLFAGRGHLRSAQPGVPALDVDDLLDFVGALRREPSEVFAELERLSTGAAEQRDVS